MIASDFVSAAYLEATGEVFTGVFGDSDASRMLSYGNLHINTWALESDVDWESMYNLGLSAGTIGVLGSYAPFTLPTGILKVSNKANDYLWVADASGNIISRWITVPAYQLKEFTGVNGYCAIQGNSELGFKVVFSVPFTTSSPEYGKTLYVPVYVTPPILVGASDVVPVDDPNWLVFMSAQEWAQPDVTLVQNVPSLVAKATDRMNAMMAENKRIRMLSQQTHATGAARGITW